MTQQAVVGIDNPDSKQSSLVVLFNDLDHRPALHHRKLPTDRPAARILDVEWRWVYRIIRNLVVDGWETHVFVEKPFVSPKFIRAAIPLSRLNGVCLSAAQRAGAASVNDAIIQDWKKAVVGSGSASKADIKAWVRKNWKPFYKEAQGQQDLCDAGCIALYGRQVIDRMDRRKHWFKEHPEEATPGRIMPTALRKV